MIRFSFGLMLLAIATLLGSSLCVLQIEGHHLSRPPLGQGLSPLRDRSLQAANIGWITLDAICSAAHLGRRQRYARRLALSAWPATARDSRCFIAASPTAG